MKYSSLLGYIIKKSDELRKKDGRRPSANYFMLAVAHVITLVEQDQIPDEIYNESASAEFFEVCAKLKYYYLVESEENIREVMFASDYSLSADELKYLDQLKRINDNAAEHGKDTLTTVDFLDVIVDELPIAVLEGMKKTENEAKAAHRSNDSSDDEDDESFDDWFEKNFGSCDGDKNETDTAEEEDEKDAIELEEFLRRINEYNEELEEENGGKKLAGIVETTRKVQDVLLRNVYGQDRAVNAFVSGYFQAQLMECTREDNRKPSATFLFAGPPGVGKTFLAEKAAEALALPFMRFDMSEYADKESNFDFCGSDSVYKNSKEGNVTGFVSKNPRSVLLFDEIEKAHINVIHLFLQILDAGRLRDINTDEEVSFTETIIIFTTNAGKNLYDDPSVMNLSAVPTKIILRALEKDVDPTTKAPLFPAAICSRFASGNVVMFDRLEASNLYTIAERELESNVRGFEDSVGIKINIDERVPAALMFSEGGKADARTVKGKANSFFHEELYELLRLLASERGSDSVESLKEISVRVPLEGLESDVAAMFENTETPDILVVADGETARECRERLGSLAVCHIADNIEKAKDILFNRDVSAVLCDVKCGMRDARSDVLNAEDVSSAGHDLLTYVLEKYSLPVYILQNSDEEISGEEFLSFAKLGVKDVLTVTADEFAELTLEKCKMAYQQGKMIKLAKENKALLYKTAQTVSESGETADIYLFGFGFRLITDTDDSKSVLDNVSRPDVNFDDVVGAEDAKKELKYFVEYLRDPVRFMRQGVRSPRGVLLYGPPGTGKTLLAKAMAGESGVTFLRAEGNEFLKKHVGEGPEAVHKLFRAARKYAPSVVFIDEIDAIGKNRSSISNDAGISDVLTAFLTEMDGFSTDTTKPVFVLAATNFGVDPESRMSLDSALLRRFDRRIYIDLPNKKERKQYIEMKIGNNKNVKLSEEQIENIALRSTGMSLAELESVFELAMRSAIHTEQFAVGDAEFDEAFETFNGGEKKEWKADSLIRTARHEAGHALVCWMSGEKPAYLTVIARGDHGGYMQHGVDEEKGMYTRRELLSRIRTSLGGRAAEIVYYGEDEGLSTGASGDLRSATRLARQMICNYGMDKDAGMIYIEGDDPGKSVNDRMREMLETELAAAVEIIGSNKKAIDAIVEALAEKNHLKEREIDEIFKNTVKY